MEIQLENQIGMEVNQLTKYLFSFFYLLLFTNCMHKENTKINKNPLATSLNAKIIVDTLKFKKVLYTQLKDNANDNNLFAIFKIENDTLKFYHYYLDSNLYDRKIIRNDNTLNFISLNNYDITNNDTHGIKFFETFFPDYYKSDFYVDKNKNILIKTKKYYGRNSSHEFVQILTSSTCIEYFE